MSGKSQNKKKMGKLRKKKSDNFESMEKKTLHWSYHDLYKVPEELLDYRDSLEDLYLKENFLVTFPEWFFQVHSLRLLQVSGNAIKRVPDEIALLTNLESLDVSKNFITFLPPSIGKLKNLSYLCVDENPLNELPIEIGQMTRLRTLECKGTLISNIPPQISNCQRLMEINLNDNKYLFEVPMKLLMLPSMLYIYADRCNLRYLPSPPKEWRARHVRLFENRELTHYPVEYEPFIPPNLHLTCPQKAMLNAQPGLPQVFINSENCVLHLPRPIERLCSCAVRQPVSLLELCLRAAINGRGSAREPLVPRTISQQLAVGPTAYCGSRICANPLFQECCLIVVRRFKTNQQYLFTQMFCSRDCTETWMLHNVENYKCVWRS